MLTAQGNSSAIKTTSYKVVLPFYLYAAFSFMVATILLFISSDNFLNHYFQPHILAITHVMALGWGTMIILGASHQLVPVLIEGKLYSNQLAYASFVFLAIGIPLLVYGFYVFNMGEPTKWGGRFIVLSILAYLINLGVSISKSKNENVHAVYVFASVVWLFITVLLGLLLVYNFTTLLLPNDSLHYLSLHAHLGIVGWFLLLVIGVASRLIPMFLISKYTNVRLLWWIFWLINSSLISFGLIFFYIPEISFIFIPGILLLAAIGLFIYYCYCAYQQRIRRQVDEQVKISLLSAIMMALPVLLLFVIVTLSIIESAGNEKNILAYGFAIFFGWITSIILGMTFKTLPFIVWNKVYHHRSGLSKTPNPKDLFSNTVFRIMSLAYLLGFILFLGGLLFSWPILLKSGAIFLLITAVLYNWNILKIVNHKPKVI